MSHRFFSSTALSCLLFIFWTPNAFAAPTQAEADVLRAFVEKAIEENAGTLQLQGIQLERAGEVKVEPKDSYYAVSTPFLTFTNIEGKAKIGVINLNMAPDQTAPHRWKAAVALPTPITITDTKGKDVTRINIGTQRFNMVLDESLGFPITLNAALEDIIITDILSQTTMSIKKTSSKINYTEEQPGLWSGPTDVSLKDITFQVRGANVKTPGTITLSEATLHSQVEKLDAALSDQYRSKMAELGNAGFSPTKMNTPQSVDAFWNIVMSYGMKQAENMTGQLRLKDFAFTPEAPIQGQTKLESGPLKIKEIGYDFDFRNLRQDKSNLTIGAFLQGAELPQTPIEARPYIPQDVRISINAQDMPFSKVIGLLGNTAAHGIALQNDPKNPKTQKDIGNTFKDMRDALGQAGTILTIQDSHLTGPDYDLALKGNFKISPTAVYGGTGTANIVFTGLDKLTQSLQSLAQKPGTSPIVSQTITKILPPLVMMQMMGQMGPGADGREARIYNLELDAQGMTKLNGADMSALQGMGGKGATPAPAAPTTKRKVSPEL